MSIRAVVAEDNLALREALRALLPLNGIDPVFCIDGAGLFDLICSEPNAYDVAIVDVTLPDVSGFDIVARLREFGFNRPVILSSGIIHNKQRLEESGGDCFLMKPYPPEELIEIIQKMVDQLD